MSQRSASASFKSTWGKFSTQPAATTTKTKLEEGGITPEKITLETENFELPLQLEDSQAIANIKTGAITGGILGALVGLSISLIITNFSSIGLAALKNFQTIHYLAPVIAAIIGAAGISLISGITGTNVPKSDLNIKERNLSKRYLVVVKGTTEEIGLAREIIARQGGVVEEADRE